MFKWLRIFKWQKMKSLMKRKHFHLLPSKWRKRKRKQFLFLLALILIITIFFVPKLAPFVIVQGSSMAPDLKVGDLIFLSQISPFEIKEGDIIVFGLPAITREAYGYPDNVIHRVVRIDNTGPEPRFRTKGDRSLGEDPFWVRAQDVKGQVGKQIPYLGLSILYLQSGEGKIFVAIAFCFFVYLLYGANFRRMVNRAHRNFFRPVLKEQRETKKALNEFASASKEYGEHLKTHTKAIQDLAKATEKLSEVAEKLDQRLSKGKSNKRAGKS